VKGVIHFLSREHALPRDSFIRPPIHRAGTRRGQDVDFCTFLNPTSLTVAQGWVEAAVKDAAPETHYQF